MNNFQQHQLSNEERYILIQDELARSGIRTNLMYGKTEFFELLDSRVGKTFDRTIAIQLYERMSKDNAGRASIDEFIKVYIEAQDFLTQNLAQTQNHLEEYEKQRDGALENLEELKHEEVLNAYGIMEGSVLTVEIFELREADRATHRDVYIVVRCGENAFQTEALLYSDDIEPIFIDTLFREIKTGAEVLQIALLTYGPNNQPEVIGELRLPVQTLESQIALEQLFELVDARKSLAGHLHLKLQWVHSRVKYLQTLIHKCEESIQNQLEDREDFEQSLAALNELFPRAAVSSFFPKPAVSIPYNQQRPDLGHNLDLNDRFSQEYPQKMSMKPHEKRSLEPMPNRVGPSMEASSPTFQHNIPDIRVGHANPNYPQAVSQPSPDRFQGQQVGHSITFKPQQQQQESLMEWTSIGKWGQISFWGTILLLILTMFGCFMKANNLSLVVCLAFLKDFDLSKRFRGTSESIMLLLVLLIITVFLDLLWLVIYTSGWGGEVLGWEPQTSALVFVLVIEYFALLLKFGLPVCYFYFNKHLKAKGQRTPTNSVGPIMV